MPVNPHWIPARVQAIRDLTPTVREFRLVPQDGALPHAPGAHIQVQLAAPASDGSAAAEMAVRSYSLVGPALPDAYRIAVKRLDSGRGGSRAMWALREGDALKVSGPANHFALSWQAPAYLLVAGGIGVTPLLGMAQALRARGLPVRMAYGVRELAERALLDELTAVLGEDLEVVVGERLDFARLYRELPSGAQVYLCGPQPMMQAARQAWQAASRPLADLRFETFGSSGEQPTLPFTVCIPRHGLSLEVSASQTLLEALEAAGVAALSDCRRGECGLCALDILSVQGEVDHRDVFLSAHEKAANRRMCVCVSRVQGSVTLDTAYRSESPRETGLPLQPADIATG